MYVVLIHVSLELKMQAPEYLVKAMLIAYDNRRGDDVSVIRLNYEYKDEHDNTIQAVAKLVRDGDEWIISDLVGISNIAWPMRFDMLSKTIEIQVVDRDLGVTFKFDQYGMVDAIYAAMQIHMPDYENQPPLIFDDYAMPGLLGMRV